MTSLVGFHDPGGGAVFWRVLVTPAASGTELVTNSSGPLGGEVLGFCRFTLPSSLRQLTASLLFSTLGQLLPDNSRQVKHPVGTGLLLPSRGHVLGDVLLPIFLFFLRPITAVSGCELLLLQRQYWLLNPMCHIGNSHLPLFLGGSLVISVLTLRLCSTYPCTAHDLFSF